MESKTSSMLNILELVKTLHTNHYNPILILDIDDTVLSSEHGKRFVDKNVLQLIQFIDSISFDNLWFLTARNEDLKRKTQNHLNHAKLLHKGQYIMYNVVHSPYNYLKEPTKGDTLLNYLIPRIERITNDNEKNWYIIVDDDEEQVHNMMDYLLLHDNHQFTLFHFA
jgi:hypothetical protein